MFGMGFTEILIIAIIAILFLGPDKLPSAMVDIAKFFRQMKTTVSSMKEAVEEEMNVSEIKQEALAYKEELLRAQDKVAQATDVSNIEENINKMTEETIHESPKEEEVTFKKKKKKKENIDENSDV